MAIKPQYFFIRSIILRNTLIPYDQIMQRRIIGRRQDAQPGPFGIVAAGWIAGLLPDADERFVTVNKSNFQLPLRVKIREGILA